MKILRVVHIQAIFEINDGKRDRRWNWISRSTQNRMKMAFSQTHSMSDPTFSDHFDDIENRMDWVWTTLKKLTKRGTKRYTKGTKFYKKVRNLTYILTFPQVDLLEYASRVWITILAAHLLLFFHHHLYRNSEGKRGWDKYQGTRSTRDNNWT